MELFDKLEIYTKVKEITGAIPAGWYAQTWEFLNKCNKAYYQEHTSIVPDSTFDAILSQFKKFEESYNLNFPDSPTRKVGY